MNFEDIRLIKKEIDRYRKAFYDVKNYENLSIQKIKRQAKVLINF